MFYLRNIMGGIETNIPIGDSYVKVDILKLTDECASSRVLIKELLELDEELPDTNIALFTGVVSFKNPGHVMYPGDGTVFYIVDERGNTFDTLRPIHISSYKGPQKGHNWADIMTKWNKL